MIFERNNIRVLIVILSIILSYTSTIKAQGWIRGYSSPTSNPFHSYSGRDVAQAPNGDYIACGIKAVPIHSVLLRVDHQGDTVWIKEFPNVERMRSLEVLSDGSIAAVAFNNGKTAILKFDAGGNLIYNNEWSWSSSSIYLKLLSTSDGGFLVASNQNHSGSFYFTFSKTDANGDTLWNKTYGNTAAYSVANDVAKTADGGFVGVGSIKQIGATAQKIYVVKTDSSGILDWQKEISVDSNRWVGHEIQQTLDGGYIITGYRRIEVNAVGYHIAIALKLDANGNQEWLTDILTPANFVGTLAFEGRGLLQNSDSTFMVTGIMKYFYNPNHQESKIPLVKIDKNGTVLWRKYFLQYTNSYNVEAQKIKPTNDNGYIIVGQNHSSKLLLIKLDSLGNVHTGSIIGNVFSDSNSNCLPDTSEQALQNWIVIAEDNLGVKHYTTTDSFGNYAIQDLPYGLYTINLAVPNPYWDTVCVAQSLSNLILPYQVDILDFPIDAQSNCPLLYVDVSAPFLRRCSTSIYNVQYCNWGTIDETNAYIQVQLDSLLIYNSSSLAATHLGGNLYQFNIGNIPAGQCGNFSINVNVDCNAQLGATHCTQANIYPDSLCGINWIGPNINLQGICLGDSIRFKVINVGGNMVTALRYNIFEDNVIMRQGVYNLNNSQFEDIYIPVQGGKTYRIEAQQAPNFPPLLGDTIATMTIEGCKLDSTGHFNVGFFTQHSNYDAYPLIDVDCQPNIGPFDPNDKLAYPKGHGPQHYIYDYTDLEYIIRFQNTGTDTAFKVVLIDSISPYLDPASIRIQGASHPYTYKVFGDGVFKIYFENIELPDSNINEPASHGFLKFRIEQQTNNPLGTIIYNNADIYFDYNAPIRTNTTFHEIGEEFVSILILNTDVIQSLESTIKVYPNPFKNHVTIEIEQENYNTIEFKLYNMMGQRIYHMATSQNLFEIHPQNLSSGTYLYRIIVDGKPLNSGKLVTD